jgi:hypothetical protein
VDERVSWWSGGQTCYQVPLSTIDKLVRQKQPNQDPHPACKFMCFSNCILIEERVDIYVYHTMIGSVLAMSKEIL